MLQQGVLSEILLDKLLTAAVEKLSKGGVYALTIKDWLFNWSPEDEELIFNNINLHVKLPSSISIIGTFASGEYELLSCIFGETEKVLQGPIHALNYFRKQIHFQGLTCRGFEAYQKFCSLRDVELVL